MSDAKVRKIKEAKIESWADALLEKHTMLSPKLKSVASDENIAPRELLIEVIKFLYLVSVSNVRLTPALIVDFAWHEFILFTKGYDEFCKAELGRFIHHTPDGDGEANQNNYLKTMQRYTDLFGVPPARIWGELNKQELMDSPCGSCKSN